MRRRATFRYPGSMTNLLDDVFAFIPDPRKTDKIDTSAEWFAGTAVYTLSKPKHDLESINDVNGELVHFMKTLRNLDSRERLVESIRLTLYAREELALALELDPSVGAIERARRFYVRQMLSRNVSDVTPTFRRQFKPKDKNGKAMTPAARTFSDPSYLLEYGARLSGVQVENLDALEFGKLYDHDSCLHFIDPPFLDETREQVNLYENEVDLAFHESLLAAILRLRGYVIFRHYRCNVYDSLLLEGWRRHDVAKRVDGAGEKIESIYINGRLHDLLCTLRPSQLRLDI